MFSKKINNEQTKQNNSKINQNSTTQNKENSVNDNNANDILFFSTEKCLINEFRSINIKMETNATIIIENENNNDNKKNENYKIKKTEARLWDENCAMISQGYESPLSSIELLTKIKEILNKMVESSYIDWNEIEPFCIEGRIYTICDNSEFRCEVYQLPNNYQNKDHKSIVAVNRMFGDGWIFQEFQTTFLKQLFKENYIVYNCGNDNSNKLNLHNILDYNFNNNNNNSNNTVDIDFNFNHNDDVINGDCDGNNKKQDIFTVDQAQQLLFDAIDCSQQRDILRENLLLLRLAIDDEKKIKVIYEIDNIFVLLLQPIIGENQLYDTWIIKTILEIVTKLIQYGLTSSSSLSQQQSLPIEFLFAILYNIKQQWANVVYHPLGMTSFYPSQQIVRICNFN